MEKKKRGGCWRDGDGDGDGEGELVVIIVHRYNYGPIDQAWQKSLLQIISQHLSRNYLVSVR